MGVDAWLDAIEGAARETGPTSSPVPTHDVHKKCNEGKGLIMAFGVFAVGAISALLLVVTRRYSEYTTLASKALN